MKSLRAIAIFLVSALLFACGGESAPATHVDLRFQREAGEFDPGDGFQAHQGFAEEQRESPFVTANAVGNPAGSPVRRLKIELNCLTDTADVSIGDIRITLLAESTPATERVFYATAGSARIVSGSQTEITLDQVVVEDGLGNSFVVTGNAVWERDPVYQ